MGGSRREQGEHEGTAGRQAGRRLDEGQGGHPGHRGRRAGEESAGADLPDPEDAPPPALPGGPCSCLLCPTASSANPLPSIRQAEVFGKLKLTLHLPEALRRSSPNSHCGHTTCRPWVGGAQARVFSRIQAVQAHLLVCVHALPLRDCLPLPLSPALALPLSLLRSRAHCRPDLRRALLLLRAA